MFQNTIYTFIEFLECKDERGSENCQRIKKKGWCTNSRYAERAIKVCMKTCTRCERQLPINKPPPRKITGKFIDNLVSIRFEILFLNYGFSKFIIQYQHTADQENN